MKKYLVAMSMALLGLCASSQEKGDMAAGVNLSVAPCFNSGVNFGIGAKYQYNVSDPIRLEAAFEYGFKNEGSDVKTIGINGHYLFNVSEKFTIYPLVGLGYAQHGFKEEYDEYNGMTIVHTEVSGHKSKFFANIGVGADYAITDNLSLGAELKFQYISDYTRLPISIGVTYRF